jgi:hypothetical protein
MLRPPETVQKLLLSSPAHFIAEFETDDFVLTHAWDFEHRSHDERSLLYRTYFILSFATAPIGKAPGVVIPDYSPTGDVMCAFMAVLFGKRFDHHGAVEMTGHFRVPDLTAASDLCEPARPYHGKKLRVDYPVSLDLRELARFRVLIDGKMGDAMLSEAFQTAALFYARALRTVNRDPEVAYLHLITACERIAETAPLDGIELEAVIETALTRIELELRDGARVARLFRRRMRQLKRRFAAALVHHLDDEFFHRSEAENIWASLHARDFPRAAAAAYDLRSRYVHTGISFGSWIKPSYDNAERQAGRPVVRDREMAKILDRAPTFIGLERLTRVLLLKCAEQLGAILPGASNPSETKGAEASAST